jgi:predicted AAA+ superfamily ATPase
MEPMLRDDYKPRLIDKQVRNYLSTFGAVCIEGPKWCGKTWTSNYHGKSTMYIGNPEGNFSNRRLAVMSPEIVLKGEVPRVIDEWQDVPSLWDAVRFEVDRRGKKGQFILTGSATPKRKGILHSGAGRIGTLRMHPMTLHEAGKSSGVVSLKALCAGNLEPMLTGEVALVDLIDYIIRGGWPGNQDLPLIQAALVPLEYINAIINNDVHKLDDVTRNTTKVRLLLRSLARNESTTASIQTLLRDIKDKDKGDIDRETVGVYLDLYSRMFLIENQLPFSLNIRSSLRLKQSEKHHLADPSLSVALLGATPEMLLNDIETLGFLFEALCVRDLRIYGETFNAKLFHYQDYGNREIDAILEQQDGSWNAFEIKLGANQIDEAAEKLLEVSSLIEKEGGRPPKTCCVISGLSNAVYQRPDGVFVIPITALRE